MRRAVFVVSTIVGVAVLAILAPSAYANQPPKAVAAAGVDPNTGQVLSQVTRFIGPADTGIAQTIAGGGSSDPDGDPLTYKWDCTDPATDGKCAFLLGVATNQVNFRPTFPPGTFDITLTVNDGQGHTASDSVRVRVQVDLTPPTVTPPDDESVSATEGGGATGAASSELHHFLFDSATASDNSTAIFTHLPPQMNGADVDDTTLLPHGTTTVTFRIADVFGNVGTATADVFVTDLRSGDLFVGVQPTASTVFGIQTKGAVQRIRGGSVSDFCQSRDPVTSPVPPGEPVFWRRPDQIVVDAKGRVTFLAPLSSSNPLSPAPQNGWGLLRCSSPGQPPEQLAIFPQGSYMDPGWPVPLPGRPLVAGTPVSGLHLRKTKHVLIDDNVNDGNPRIVTEEKYVLAFAVDMFPGTCCHNGGHIGSLSLDAESLVFAEDDISPVGVGVNIGEYDLLPEMFFHSKTETVSFLGLLGFPAPVAKTYVTGGGVLRRIHQPFEVQLTANTSAGTVQFGVQAFAGFTDMPNNPANLPHTGFILDDVTLPNAPSGCNPSPPTRGDWPIRPQPGGGSYTSLSSMGVIFEENSGLVVNDNSWFGHLDESLFDLDPQNDAQSYFARPETGCRTEPIVNFTPVAGTGVLTSFSSYDGYHTDSLGGQLWPDRMAASPNGLFGSIAASGRVVQATGAVDVVEVATGLAAPRGLGAFPPQLGKVQLSALIIRIDSPVEVVLTDALGRRVGVQNGQAINEFGGQAHDTGAQTHPRLYIIQFPQPGNYTLRSTGTDSGPFTVHVYSVNSAEHVTEHISQSGDAQPGRAATHDFDLSAHGRVAFANSAPVADAGSDQAADADSSGKATFVLDGSRSRDPDGDPLEFRWAGPFGILSGAQVNARVGVGVHELTLTVDDGKGGLAEDTVTVTVNGADDTVPPTTTAGLGPLPNDAGWNDTAIAVSLTTVDNPGGSGVQEITYSISGAQVVPITTVAGDAASIPVTVEGISVITYFATDSAGNVEGPKTLTARLDQTVPTIAGTAAPAPNAGGWNHTPVTVSFQCTDALSGLAAGSPPAPTIRSSDGAGQSVGGTCVDVAGNRATAFVQGINIDVTAPLLTAPPDQMASQTSAAGAAVSYPPPTIVETGSGIASSGCLPASGSVFPIGLTPVLCTARDRADNGSSVTFTVTVTPLTVPPDGRMFGAGFIDQGGTHRHFTFRVAQIRNHEYGRLEYWDNDPRRCGPDDDSDRTPGFTGEHDRDFGRDHRSPPRHFDATSIDSVTFSDDPGFQPGRGPRPAVDTVRFRGIGKWNGRGGYTFEASATDQGEPGSRRDTFSLVIKDARGNVVNAVSGSLTRGNVQSTRRSSRPD